MSDDTLWEKKFPYVSFNDKVCVEFIDGTEMVCKHLYHDDAVLYDIDWSQVVEVYEV